MKKLLLLLTTFIAVACNGQDQCGYSQSYIDSLETIINTQDVQLNQCYDLTNNMGVQIHEQMQVIDSILGVNESLKSALESQVYPTDTLIYTQDTICFKYVGEGITATLSVQGEQINYYLYKGKHRLDVFYNDNQFREYMNYDKGTYDSWLHTFAIPIK